MAFIHPEAADFSAVAKAALAAAAALGLPPQVVASSSDGQWGMGLVVPDEVAEHLHQHLTSSQAPIRIDGLATPELVAAEPETVEPETVEPQEPQDKPKRGPGRPRKAAAKTEDLTEDSDG